MSLDTQRYTHVPLYVEAVQVTAENMAEVAEWCDSTLAVDDKKKQYIKIGTIRPQHERQTMAYVGDWVMKTDVGLKTYTNKAFTRGFVPAPLGVVDDRPDTMKTMKHDPPKSVLA